MSRGSEAEQRFRDAIESLPLAGRFAADDDLLEAT